MRISKIFLLALLTLVFTTQACSPPAQALTPQVVTVVVTAVPTGTPLPSLTSEASTAPSPTSPPQATGTSSATPAPSPTFPPRAIPTNTPVRVVALPAVSNLPAQGPQGGDIDFAVVMSPNFLMQIKARKHGSAKDGDGIDHVLFIVKNKNNEQVYSSSESTAKFCIFKGGEPDCNSWPISNGRYHWGASGPEIKSGDYQVTIRVALKSDPSNESEWSFPITIKLP